MVELTCNSYPQEFLFLKHSFLFLAEFEKIQLQTHLSSLHVFQLQLLVLVAPLLPVFLCFQRF